MSRVRALVLATLACAAWWACTEGSPTGAGSAVSLGIVPRFQISPADFDGGPIDRVRLTAIDVATDDTVGSVDQAVSPTAAQWILPLGIDLGDEESLQILVEAELFSGATVAWSGRLGPITVPNAAPALALDVSPGPLDNQDVTDIAIVGAPTQLVIGQTATLTADVTLEAGSAASPVVYWISSDSTVATVTPQGPTATVTAVAAGSVDIAAVAGPALDEVPIEVVAIPQVNTWQGATNDWHTDSNWSSGFVPQPAQNVVIPASGFNPVIVSDVEVTNLTVEGGALLTLSTADLTVTGDLDVSGLVDGTGEILMNGAGATVRGTITVARLEVAGAVSANGTLTVDFMEITGTGSFDVGGQGATVTELTTRSGGTLRMLTGSDLLTVGDALFDGGSTAGLLTGGTMHVLGSFTATDNSSASFAASGTHEVVFDGPADQTIHFDQPGQSQGRFQNVSFDQPNVMTFTSDFAVGGLLSVVDGTVDASSVDAFVAGGILDPNAGLDIGGLYLTGAITAFPAALPADVFVQAPVAWPRSATIDGNLTVDVSLNLGATTLTVNGDITLNGTLTIPAGTLAGSASLTLASGSTLNVDGVITLGGSCVDNGATILGSGIHPCGGTPFTKTWVGGDTGGSPTDWDNPANWSPSGVPGASDVVGIPVTGNPTVLSTDASVQSLVVSDGASIDVNGHALSVSTDLDAGGTGISGGSVILTGSGALLEGVVPDMDVQADRALSGSLWLGGTLTLTDAELDTNDQYVSVSNGDLVVTGPAARLVVTQAEGNVYVSGDVTFDGADHDGFLTDGYLSLAGDFTVTDRSATGFAGTASNFVSFDGTTPQSVSFQIPGASQQRFNDVWVYNSSGVTFSTNAVATGDTYVSGRMIVPMGVTVDVGGDLTLGSGSELQVEGTLNVTGSCIDQGAVITGGGTQPCGTPASVDYTWVGGASPNGNDWNNPDNWTPVGVPGSTDAVIVPSATPPQILSSSTSIGSIVVSSSTYVDLNGFTLTIDGDASVGFNGLQGGTANITGTGTVLEGTFQDLQVSGDRALSGGVSVLGDLTLDATLDVSNQTLSVVGNLNVQGANGMLRSTNPAGAAYVSGDAVFNGADHTNALTDGRLYLQGDLLATGSATSFVSSGNHLVWLYGADPQTVTFQSPGPGQQRLNDVITQNTFGVTFASDVYVTGDLDQQFYLSVLASTTTTVGGTLTLYGGSLLEAYGTVTGSCVDNGAIIIGTGAPPPCQPTAANSFWMGTSPTDPTNWDDPDNWYPVGVPAASDTVVILYAQGNYPVVSRNIDLAGITLQQSAGLDLATHTLTVSGDVLSDGDIFGGLTVVTGTGSVLEGYVEDLRISAPRTTSYYLSVDGDLTVQDQLTLGSSVLAVNGDLTVETAAGEIVMGPSTGGLYVYGNTTFDGASLDGDLTGGSMWLEGDLTVANTNGSGSTFRSTGTPVYLSGSTQQIVSFSDPGTDNTKQSFYDLVIQQTGGSVLFETSAYVANNLQAVGQTLTQGSSGTLEVAGQVYLSEVTFDGLPLRLVTDRDATFQVMADVTFKNMLSTVTQLYISMPSVDAGNNQVASVIDSPVFETMPSGGGYYVEATNSLGAGVPQLDVQLTNPTPPTATEYKAGTNTKITWGP